MGSEFNFKSKLNPYDQERALKILPEVLKNIMMDEGKNLVVAGGFLRCTVSGDRIKDIDCFSTSASESKRLAIKLATNHRGILSVMGGIASVQIQPDISTRNAYSIKNVDGHFVQFIHRWTYETPAKLINSFDFTIARAALWFDESQGIWDSVVDDRFYSDLAAKRLVFCFPERIEEPAGSMLRVLKFVKKGYVIPSESLAGVVGKLVSGSGLNWPGPGLPVSAGEVQSSVYRSIKNMTGES